MRNYTIRRAAIFALVLLTSCGRGTESGGKAAGDGAPRATHNSLRARQFSEAEPFIRPAAWRIIPLATARGPRLALLSGTENNERLAVLKETSGYEVRTVRVSCERGGAYGTVDVRESLSDDQLPTIRPPQERAEKQPYIQNDIQRLCRGEGSYQRIEGPLLKAVAGAREIAARSANIPPPPPPGTGAPPMREQVTIRVGRDGKTTIERKGGRQETGR